ncbi:hypothetical protein DPMN_123576 [Dreissena polymorpha]|uniref:Uncharacterized protein n=1 Tax=Dreissena polymorpha TaxID=45954 RepID=A0A9D4JVB1_DREPO|nr:hypothetical protein DPMN_123576 [Dreissena polymorpha]
MNYEEISYVPPRKPDQCRPIRPSPITHADRTRPVHDRLVGLDISDLERRQSRVFDSLLPAVDITVDRDNIVDDVLTLYRSKPDIIHHRLNVTFEGEEAA